MKSWLSDLIVLMEFCIKSFRTFIHISGTPRNSRPNNLFILA